MDKDVSKFGTSDKRGLAQTSSDPYANRQHYADGASCSTCHAQYRNKRWYPAEEALAKGDNAPEMQFKNTVELL